MIESGIVSVPEHTVPGLLPGRGQGAEPKLEMGSSSLFSPVCSSTTLPWVEVHSSGGRSQAVPTRGSYYGLRNSAQCLLYVNSTFGTMLIRPVS